MKILALDTATRYLSLGLYDGSTAVRRVVPFYDGGKVYEYDLIVERRLSGLLGTVIKSVLDAVSWDARMIDYFACGLGPGSFTAVRIGMAMIKGLSWSMNKPIAGISTLDVIAANAPDSAGYVVPVMDARRNLVYTAFYKRKGRTLKRRSPYLLLNTVEFFKKIKGGMPLSRKDTVAFLGDGLELLRNDIRMNVREAVLLDKDYWYPKGHTIVDLALERIRERKLSNAFNIQPVYLYPKECQIRVVK